MITTDQNNADLNPTIGDNLPGTDKSTEKTQPTSYRAITASSNDLKGFAQEVAAKYGLDWEKMETTINCESGFKSDPPGNLVSRGVAQFTLDTWLEIVQRLTRD